MVKWLVYAAGALALVAAVVVIAGYLLPVAHVASVDARFDRAPAQVFAAIAEVERYAEWRPDVARVDLLSREPRKRWKESGRHGDITFELEEMVPPARLRTRIVDRSLPFGGTWTYELTPEGAGTRLRITERGEVYNPVFRFMSRFVFGHTATMNAYLDALGRRL